MPSDPAVIAACLDAPWGLAVLPDGQSALVGERTTGRILSIAQGKKPQEYAKVDGIDASGTGGLLGIALSPSYDEDGLIYLYATTKTDNRVLRLAQGDTPKPILTGIPKGAKNNGGRIEFGPDDQLYIATGDTGSPAVAAQPDSLAGKLLRVDAFGKPSNGNPGGTAVYASGFSDPTGMCARPSGVAVVDHRSPADVVVDAKAGKNYRQLGSGSTLWSFKASEGGANDCAQSARELAFSSLTAQRAVALGLDPQGAGFVGKPVPLVEKKYGRLLTLTVGGATPDDQLFWATTSNKDGKGKPVPADDRVIVIKANSAAGGAGND